MLPLSLMNTRTYSTIVIVLALLGLADAVYLTEIALTGGTLACDIAGLNGCNVVAQSSYSRVLGLPLALYGVIFYGGLLLTFIASRVRPHRTYFLVIALIAGIGVLFSTYFLYVQIALIHALCIYCIGSAGIAYLLGILTYNRYRLNEKVVRIPIADSL